MSANAHILHCNGAKCHKQPPQEWKTATIHDLNTFGINQNVRLVISDLTDRMYSRLPRRIHDLLEIAALVYAADQSCSRSGRVTIDYGDHWHRRFRFEVAVRDRYFWEANHTKTALQETLAFLSDDHFEFHFVGMAHPPSPDIYLDFLKDAADPDPVERVMLFSGGLDSLSGAVDEILTRGRRVALVSHKPVDHLAKKQRELVSEISRRSRKEKPPHFPVEANRIGEDRGDYTQRTRSFLYASIAVAVAEFFQLSEVYFYENGIVSINLPFCSQIIGGRATRTTHPKTLHEFTRLFSLILDRQFQVRNEFLWETKEDMLNRLKKAGHADLAKTSLSCSHTRMLTKHSPHCGLCSQCMSRRVAALGADYGDNDPSGGYRVDVLTDSRQRHEDRTLAERFIGSALRVETMASSSGFHSKYAGELARVYPYLSLSAGEGAAKVFDLHLRHAKQVGKVMTHAMVGFAEERRTGRLAESCMLNYAFDAAIPAVEATRRMQDELKTEVDRLGDLERRCISALAKRHIVGATADKKPSNETIAKWVGVNPDANFKRKLSVLVRLKFLDNARHTGGRGGYFLTEKGDLAVDLFPNGDHQS